MRRKDYLTLDAFLWTWVVAAYTLSATFVPKSGVEWKEKSYASIYFAASKLTDPLCTAHQYLRKILLVDSLHPAASTAEKYVRKGMYYLGTAAHGSLALLTTVPGIELRLFAKCMQEKPFIYYKGKSVEKKLEDLSLSLLSWNVCCVSGGYSITDGGVMPWPYRIRPLEEAIFRQNADIVCLYEIFDIQTALRLIETLRSRYVHFYFNIGPRIIGLSSGLFVASKVQIENPEFIAFPVETNDGRSKHCRKGFFSFEIAQEGKNLAKIYATHLQHSEFPASPTRGEVMARKLAMELILSHMKKEGDGKACILTGDLNLEEKELSSSTWNTMFDRGKILSSGKTWGGDHFCALLTGKPASSPLNLDHTFTLSNAAVALTTSYVETGFDGTYFYPDAISDHRGLFSIITFKK